jgi:cobalt-precorrin-5B (C1)-methyltransferase
MRRGWTTGACATAAAKAAYTALIGDGFPDPVEITLPRGQHVAFALAETSRGPESATAGVVKDAGDDPDVTHGALIRATATIAPPGSGVTFKAGPGVGTITRPGLPLPPGEPAINPVPRRMIRDAISQVAVSFGRQPDVVVEISIPAGEVLAQRTLNGRLGIVGGLSILGTTGIVVPYSCAAWIDSILRGIDVARAAGIEHVAGATGSSSEAAVRALHGLPEIALLEMGDFVGGMLKYLRAHPVRRVTVAGGIAKMTKLAQGRLDLHSRRGTTDFQALADMARARGGSEAAVSRIATANTVAEAFAVSDVPLGDAVAEAAWTVAAAVLRPAPIELELVVFDRAGALAGRHGFAPVHEMPPERNLRR